MNLLDINGTQRIGIRACYINEDIVTEEDSSKKINSKFIKESAINKIIEIGEKSFQPRFGFMTKLDDDYTVNFKIGLHQVIKNEIDMDGNYEAIIEKLTR
jgi:hypothetical protein